MTLSGEFCPLASDSLKIIFLVDFSLSMYNKSNGEGNDPIVNGSCGRMSAVEAIVNRVLETSQNTSAQAAIVPFSIDVIGSPQLSSLNQFQNQITAENLCGGVRYTNYKAGFDGVYDLLANTSGEKIIYFITDGLPTYGGGGENGYFLRHRDAATTSASRLRSMENLTLNTIFLGNVFDDASEHFQPQAFLEEITGSADRVKIVSEADQLASQILNINRPLIAIDPSTVSGLLQNQTHQRPLEIIKFENLNKGYGAWSFTTTAFDFQSMAFDKFILRATDTKGDSYELVYEFAIEAESSTNTGFSNDNP